jgi:hypothetical protein
MARQGAAGVQVTSVRYKGMIQTSSMLHAR